MKEIIWRREWFRNLPKYSHEYFDNTGNQKSFLYEIADRQQLQNTTDWKLISLSLIKMNGGVVR